MICAHALDETTRQRRHTQALEVWPHLGAGRAGLSHALEHPVGARGALHGNRVNGRQLVHQGNGQGDDRHGSSLRDGRTPWQKNVHDMFGYGTCQWRL